MVTAAARAFIAAMLALMGPTFGGKEAATAAIITVHPNGEVSVRFDGAEALMIPAPVAGKLRNALDVDPEPRLVEDLLAGDACIGRTNARLASATAAYALSLVPEELSTAVVLGVIRCNPDVSDDIETATGLISPRGNVGSVEPIPLGGIGGGGSQELARGGSPSRL